MIVAVAVASVVTGFVVGWVAAMNVITAAISFSQRRMQRKVRYWQAQAALARAQARAERMARDAIAHDVLPDRW